MDDGSWLEKNGEAERNNTNIIVLTCLEQTRGRVPRP